MHELQILKYKGMFTDEFVFKKGAIVKNFL